MATISEALTIAVKLHQAGQFAAAEKIYRQILRVEPEHLDALHLLGVAAHQLGRHQEAVDSIRRAIQLRGTEAPFHNNLGEAYRALGNASQAIVCFRRALELKPDYAIAYYNLGVLHADQGHAEEAVACYHRALALKPDYAEVHNNLGLLLAAQGNPAAAATCYRRALELKPDYLEAHNNLGIALADQGHLDGAIASYRRALELKPDYAEAHNNLGSSLWHRGQPDEAVACYRRALELKPDYAVAHSTLLATYHYRAGVTAAAIAAAHADYDRRQALPLRGAIRPHANSRDPLRKLRLGFVSPDFGRHPVGYFLVRTLENLDREDAEVFCYSDRTFVDDLSQRLQSAAAQWRDASHLSDQGLAEQVRADRIDILFDLVGHTTKNRLLAFARKPVPIQITWLGYEGTTGLSAMDYILADRHTIPLGAEAAYCERVLRLPDDYVCYEPPDAAPAVSPPPVETAGNITFGCFNSPVKIGPAVVEVWAKILRRLPQARLRLKYRGWGNPAVVGPRRDLFAAHGVDASRLEFDDSSPYQAYLEAYNRIDVALDPFPFTGGITTCEALWMGVPVVTCPGETFASRHGLSHLSTVGLTETIARDLDEYVEIAVALANDRSRLAAIRGRLRRQVADSPLCDGPRFAANLLKLLRDVWRQWCAAPDDAAGRANAGYQSMTDPSLGS